MELEGQLELIEIKSQWSKRMALQKLLPLEIKEEVKSLLRITKTRSGNDIYFRLKQELLDLFGVKNQVLSGKPSQLGKKLMTFVQETSNSRDATVQKLYGPRFEDSCRL